MDLRALLMGLGFVFMWSSAFTSAKIIVAHAPPFAALSFRFLAAGLIGVLIARAVGQTWTLTRGQWRSVVVFGVCQNVLYLGMNWFAAQKIEAGLASIIASAMPLVVALLEWLVRGQRMRPLGIAGLVAGFAGVALIMGTRLGGDGVDPLSLAACVAGAVALAVATLTVGGTKASGNVLMVVGLQMLVGGVILLGVSAATETVAVTWSLPFVIAFLYTMFVPGLLATWVWFRLVARIGTVRAATFHFLNPFFGVSVGAVLLGEVLKLTDAIGVAIVMAGILAVQMSRRDPAERPPP